ncbi:hypothetical protein EMIHUDRAFT_205349 [Emiliania huxleyi CCMP1516]|uniref:Neurotransmitter-gated ion-channel ligand-binding domain-containing protein n=2 Tax=Emiliania huxleyi TaxID=2903 RepID=A0A0D3JS66_EMIH1|nr:hypothetical protein EMIHUDRAFT_205349 [Emiliania huxleyi CCMP1516]EOD26351.1 hypothetical protein EMIHUDRAFT_205349 [Emiliania huxleyi CCMP1516]|eukprot:XP_005778780.1 hypothetical protein EMIHUDRAFT_205349 [Emiliania huxleyi CCMP1516]
MATVALLNQLLVGYDSLLLSMHSVNERERSYTIDGYLVLQWSDPRLEFGNLSCRDAIALPSYANTDTKLWEPGVQCMETLHESVGGSSGATHIAGESLVISRNGTVLWSRRARYKLLCDTFNFGRMPFDEQFCIATLRSFPYNEELVQLEWPDCASNPVACGGSGQLQPYHSGEWIVTIVDQRTVTEADGHRVARVCIMLERHSNLLSLSITIVILLVIAAYCGFFIPVSAAPARVAIGFLSFLMALRKLGVLALSGVSAVYHLDSREQVLNQLFWAMGQSLTEFSTLCRPSSRPVQMPPLLDPSENYRVWMIDFLWGSMFFNWLTLIEYGLVHFGLECERRLAAGANAPPAGEHDAALVAQDKVGSRYQHVKLLWMRCATRFADLDNVCRWVYPPAYFIFCCVMYGVVDKSMVLSLLTVVW